MCWPCCDNLITRGKIDDDSGDWVDVEKYSLTTGDLKSNINFEAAHSNNLVNIYAYGPDGKFYVRNWTGSNTLARCDASGAIEQEYPVTNAVVYREWGDSNPPGAELFDMKPHVVAHSDGSLTFQQDYGVSHPKGYGVKYDSSGAVVWERGAGDGYGPLNMCLNTDDSIWTSTPDVENVTTPPYRANPVIARLDPSDGSEQFRFTCLLSNRGQYNAYPMAAYADGSVLVGCFTGDDQYVGSYPGNTVAKYSSAGTVLWSLQVPYTLTNVGMRAEIDRDGNSYVMHNYINGGFDEIRVSKIDSSGVVQWFTTVADSADWASAIPYRGNHRRVLISLDRQGNLYAAIGYRLIDGNDIQLRRIGSGGVPLWTTSWGSNAGYPRNLYARKGTYPLG